MIIDDLHYKLDIHPNIICNSVAVLRMQTYHTQGFECMNLTREELEKLRDQCDHILRTT